MPESPKNVCCVLVNFRAAQDTIACVQSVLAMTSRPARIVIVENGSRDDSWQILQTTFPASVCAQWGVTLLQAPLNLGFAGGCNLGARSAIEQGFTGWIWLLNNDTLVRADALEAMLACAQQQNAQVIGSRVVSMEDPTRVLGGAGILNPWTATVRSAKLSEANRFSYLEGSSLLIAPQCWQQMGGLPEDYFLYFEETDFCLTARKAGFHLAWALDSIVRHHVGRATGSGKGKGEVPFFADCLMIRNRLHMARKHKMPFLTVWAGWKYSLLLRLVRRRGRRVLTIVQISLSTKAFWRFVDLHRN